jgi:hypothetical protein
MFKCEKCGAGAPTEQLMVEHLAEHGYGTKAEIMEQIANAPVVFVDENGVESPIDDDD